MHSIVVFFVVMGVVSAYPGYVGDILDPYYVEPLVDRSSPVGQNQVASGLGPISQNQVAQNNARDYSIYERSLYPYSYGPAAAVGAVGAAAIASPVVSPVASFYPLRSASPTSQNQVANGGGPVTQNQVANRRGLYPFSSYAPYGAYSPYWGDAAWGRPYAAYSPAYATSNYSPVNNSPISIQNELKNRRLNDRVVSHNEFNNLGL